jgi:GDP-4-dehydro-6-deoxy-D-mannose reductase
MRVLVTGAGGFVGRHLREHLEANGDQPFAVGWPAADGQGASKPIDVTDAAAVRDVVEAARPDAIIHLAGLSSVAASHRDPARTFAVNTLGAVHVLAAAEDVAPRARILLIGSSEAYGAVKPGIRQTEDALLAPVSPYAASKVAAEVAGFQFYRARNLAVIGVRPFNHIGRGQRNDFVVPSFAEQIAAIRRSGKAPILRVGNLDAVRDFSHVSDVVEAYLLLLRRGEPGQAYNVCSGEGRSIRTIVDRMIELAGVEVRIEVDPSRFRPSELPYLVGDPAKLQRLGWRASRSLDDALRDALEYAAERASN